MLFEVKVKGLVDTTDEHNVKEDTIYPAHPFIGVCSKTG
jgi:hypothetical protein